MNKLKYVVLFVVISCVFTFFIIYYNNINSYERNGYEIKNSSKTICSTCKTIISLNDETYYSVYSNLELRKNTGEVIKTFTTITTPRILFKTSDGNGVVVYYKDNNDNNFYVSYFNNKGEQSAKSGPYKNLMSDTKTNKNSFYLVTTPQDLYYVVKFDDQGKEIFNKGLYNSVTILHENQDGVIFRTYDNTSKKYRISSYNLAGIENWVVEENNFYQLTTFENEFVYYTLENDGKYIYKLNFDGSTIKAGPLERKYDNNKLFKTSDNRYLIANTLNNQKVITIYDENLNVLKQIEGYNYSNLTKSFDSDEFILTNTNGSEISLVKLDQDGKQLYSKVINSPFTIKLFTSNEVVYTVKVNNLDLNVYLDQDGNKKWEKSEVFYGTFNKENKTYNYLVKGETNYTLKTIDKSGKEIYSIGPSSLINRIAYFNNGDLLFYYKNPNTDETSVKIVDQKGNIIYEGILASSENRPDQMIIYSGEDEIHINRDYIY